MLLFNWLFRNKENNGLKETKELYTKADGTYLSDRKALHHEIIRKLMNRTNQEQGHFRPTAYFFGGGSGSGKSTLKAKLTEDHPALTSIKVVHADPDEIKNYLPEYELYKKRDPQKAALLVHKESCDIRDKLVDELMRKRKPFIYESTMAKPGKYKRLFSRLKQEGYTIHLYLVDVPLALAMERSAARAKRDGRVVPVHVIRNTHKLVPQTFLNVRDLADSYSLYENRKNLKPILSCEVKNPDLYNDFLKKS